MEKITAAVLVVLMLIVIMAHHEWSESFADRREKARAIFNWFSATPKPTFTKFRKDITDSNVVEYEAVLELKNKNQLTESHIAQAVL